MLDSREVSAHHSLHGASGKQHLRRLLEPRTQGGLKIGYFDMFKRHSCS